MANIQSCYLLLDTLYYPVNNDILLKEVLIFTVKQLIVLVIRLIEVVCYWFAVLQLLTI